ncbi:TROVE domain-containing protein, partial [Streptomyces sp. NPDC057690]
MARFNTRDARPVGRSLITTVGAQARTHEGATGYLRDAKSELFLLAVSNMVGTDTFYETGGQRDDRYTRLVRQLAIADPEWTAGLLGWLRGEGNMRTAALVGAAEFTAERLLHEAPGYSRQVIDSVLQRPDEPGEMLGYWTAHYGRRLPKPVKRGIADAAQRLYNEAALLKYDTDSKGYRFGDVLELVHAAPAPDKRWQGDLFKHAIDRRHGRTEDIPARLSTLLAREQLMATPLDQRRQVLANHQYLLQHAGMTWESLAGWLQGPMDAAAWEAVIPSMGLMALIRNLRNFDEAGVSDEAAEQVIKRLADPQQIAKSRQLPMRFYSAFNAAP